MFLLCNELLKYDDVQWRDSVSWEGGQFLDAVTISARPISGPNYLYF